MDKKGNGENRIFPKPFFSLGKKGMEMWKLVSIMLVIIFLLVALAFYGFLGGELKNLFSAAGELW